MKNVFKIFIFCFLTISRVLGAADDATQLAFNEGIAQAQRYVTSKGDQLRYTCFKTPLESQGSVVFVQGRGTFLEFYEVVITEMLQRGLNVWMYDLSGQGGSSRLVSAESHDEKTVQYMQHVESFDQYVEDLNAFVEDIVMPNTTGGVLFLGGYSTGGHVALRYLQEKSASHPFQAAFMISPLLTLSGRFTNVLTYMLRKAPKVIDLTRYIPGKGHVDPVFSMPFKENPYTSYEEGFCELKQLCVAHEPLMMGGVTFGWVRAAADSLSRLWSKKAIESIQIPVLIATGGSDGVVDVSNNYKFASSLKHGCHLYFKEGKHELFRETEDIRGLLWIGFDGFLELTKKGRVDERF